MYNAHLSTVTDNRYSAQALPLPMCSHDAFGPWSYKRHMADFVFDLELVRSAMKERSITRQALAEGVGLTHPSAVSKILDGSRKVKVEEAARIYDFLKLVPIQGTATSAVPIIGLAAAGNWREAVEMPIGRMVIPSHVAGHRAFAVEIKGDSMDKIIEDGGWVVIDPDDHVLRPNKLYLLQNDDFGVTVKRYQRLPARFEPVSSNPEHKEFEVSEVKFHILGRVVWKGEAL